MSLDPVRNFAESYLTSGILSSATEITLPVGHTDRFPNPNTEGEFNLVIYNKTDFHNSSEAIIAGEGEIIRVKSLNDSTYIIERAQENTTAVDLKKTNVVYSVIETITSKVINDISNSLNNPLAFIGEIKLFAGSSAPKNWAFCKGQSLLISEYSELYSIIGTTYGGDGQTNFCLPDLRGRSAMGSGAAPGVEQKILGQAGGNDFTTLSTDELPPHAHPITDAAVEQNLHATGSASLNLKCQGTPGNSKSPEGKHFAATKGLGGDLIYGDGADKTMKADTITIDVPVTGDITLSGNTSSVGNGNPFSNLPPYLVVDYIICVNGILPNNT